MHSNTQKINTSNSSPMISTIAGWSFGILIFIIGILNLIQVHPVPGIAYMLLAFIYFPFVNNYMFDKFGFRIPAFVKIILGIVIMWFTLGVSDLAEIYGI